jgi:hypothetical protein
LLLFLNGEDWDVMSNPAALQVLHISELGPERQPPPRIRPVHDETYTGPDYGFVRSQAEGADRLAALAGRPRHSAKPSDDTRRYRHHHTRKFRFDPL